MKQRRFSAGVVGDARTRYVQEESLLVKAGIRVVPRKRFVPDITRIK